MADAKSLIVIKASLKEKLYGYIIMHIQGIPNWLQGNFWGYTDVDLHLDLIPALLLLRSVTFVLKNVTSITLF